MTYPSEERPRPILDLLWWFLSLGARVLWWAFGLDDGPHWHNSRPSR